MSTRNLHLTTIVRVVVNRNTAYLPADLYAGTARYYARYRVPYPEELLGDLRKRAEITGDGRLLDLACGPGRVALPLSPYFSDKTFAVMVGE